MKKKYQQGSIIRAMPTRDRRESMKTRTGHKIVKRYFEKPALGKSAGSYDIFRRVLKELAGVIT